VFDKAVGEIVDARLLMGEGIDHQIVHSLVTFGLYCSGAIGEGFLDEGDDVGLGLVLIALGIFLGGRLLAQREVGEEIVRSGSVKQLFGKAALGGSGFEVVFVFGKILGHGDE